MLPEALVGFIDEGIGLISAFEQYASQTVVLVPSFVSDWNINIVEKMVISFLVSYPLGFIMYLLPYGYPRHVFGIVMGVALVQFMLESLWIHLALSATVYYFLLVSVPRRYIQWVIPGVAYGHLSFCHLYVLYMFGICRFMICIPFQMMFTQRITMLAYNVYDGYIITTLKQQKNKEDSNNTNNQSTTASTTTRLRQEEIRIAMKCANWAILSTPNIIEYLGYIFCYSLVINGPVIEFAIYKNAINGDNLRKKKNGKILSRQELPSNVWPTLKPLLQALALMWLHVQVFAYYQYRNLAFPEVINLPWWRRFVYVNMACIPVRTMFYTPWKLAEGANNLWYAGFDGYLDDDGDDNTDATSSSKKPPLFTNAQNVDIYQLEIVSLLNLSVDFANLSKTWNMKTSNYLKRYMYYRSNGSLAYTYFMSALWHGFHPCLYLVAGNVVLFTQLERLGRQRLDQYVSKIPNFTWRRRIANVLCFSPYYYGLVYFIGIGDLRSWENIWIFWKSHYFYGHIFLVLCFLIINVIPPPRATNVNDNDDPKMQQKQQQQITTKQS